MSSNRPPSIPPSAMGNGNGSASHPPISGLVQQSSNHGLFDGPATNLSASADPDRVSFVTHILWDLTTVPLPVSPSPEFAADRVRALAAQHGLIASVHCIAGMSNHDSRGRNSFPPGDRRGDQQARRQQMALQRALNMEVSMDYVPLSNVPTTMLTSLLSLSVSAAQRGEKRATLILLTNQPAMAPAMAQLAVADVFAAVLLVYDAYKNGRLPTSGYYPPAAAELSYLQRQATIVVEWEALLRATLPPGALLSFEGPTRNGGMVHAGISSPSRAGPPMPYARKSSYNASRQSSMRDLQMLLKLHQQQAGAENGMHIGFESTDISQPSSAASSSYPSRPTTPPTAAAPALHNGRVSTAHSRGTSGASVASTSSSAGSATAEDEGGRPGSAMTNGERASMGGVLPVPLDNDSTDITELTIDLMLERLPSQTRAYVLAFRRVLEYMERERVIPRESAIRKRLGDTLLPDGRQLDIDFETLLSLAVDAGVAVVEGVAPQRIIYPSAASLDGPTSQPRRFEAADFFQPKQRLDIEQTYELLIFLKQVSPSADRGRFGMAQWLEQNGPPFVQLLPHGVLVELVQLLLNQKILLFRKGRVSVSPNLPYADLRALAALSVMSKPHTALLSTSKGVQGQQSASQLKFVYEQLVRQAGTAQGAVTPTSAQMPAGTPFTLPNQETAATAIHAGPPSLPTHPRRPLSAETGVRPSIIDSFAEGAPLLDASGLWAPPRDTITIVASASSSSSRRASVSDVYSASGADDTDPGAAPWGLRTV